MKLTPGVLHIFKIGGNGSFLTCVPIDLLSSMYSLSALLSKKKQFENVLLQNKVVRSVVNNFFYPIHNRKNNCYFSITCFLGLSLHDFNNCYLLLTSVIFLCSLGELEVRKAQKKDQTRVMDPKR